MSIENLKERLPEYAKDLKLNLSSIMNQTELTEQQLWGTLLVSAIASRNPEVLAEVQEEASQHLNEAALRAAKGAAAVMAMNNIYYRFLHLVESPDYRNIPAKLRMNLMMNPGVDKVDFEIWSTAVSAINGCGACLSGHESALMKHGTSKDVVAQTVRIASIIHAVAVTLEAEKTA